MTELERVVGTERFAPPTLLQRLRAIEPASELVYLGDGEWWLGRWAPNPVLREVGWRKVKQVSVLSAGHKATKEAHRRWLVGRLQQEGFQHANSYWFHGEPDGRIENDLLVADYQWKLARAEAEKLAQAHEEKGRDKAAAELRDPYRAADAWRTAFTLQHAMKDIRAKDGRSGFTTVKRMQ